MLMVGNYGLSLDEQRAQMALWAIFASPLFMSTDLRTLSEEAKAILQNKEVLAVNQDPLGVQGRLVGITEIQSKFTDTVSQQMVFSRPLSDNSVAVVLFNSGSFGGPSNMTVDFSIVGLSGRIASVRDLFEHKDIGIYTDTYSTMVNPSGVKFLKLTPDKGKAAKDWL